MTGWLVLLLVAACGEGHDEPSTDSGIDAAIEGGVDARPDAGVDAGPDAGTDAGSCPQDPPRDPSWDVAWPESVDDPALAAEEALQLFSGHWDLDPAACPCPANDCPGVLEGPEHEGWEVTYYWTDIDGTGPFLRDVTVGKRESEIDGILGSEVTSAMYVYRKALEPIVVGIVLRHEPADDYIALVGFESTPESASFVFDGWVRLRFDRENGSLVTAHDVIAFVGGRVGDAEPFSLSADEVTYEDLLGDDDELIVEAALRSATGRFPDDEEVGILEALTRAMENESLLASTRISVADVVLQAAANPDTILRPVALDRLLGRLRLDPDAAVREAVAESLRLSMADSTLPHYTCDMHEALSACAADDESATARLSCAGAIDVGLEPAPPCE